jgi:hypothetical protein
MGLIPAAALVKIGFGIRGVYGRSQALTKSTLPQTGGSSHHTLFAVRKRSNFTPLVVLLGAALIFFARVLFTNRYIVPWDFRGFHLPLAMTVFDAMKGTGSVLWDTTTYCGRPVFADPQTQVFYPPTDFFIFVATFFGSSQLAYVLEWELMLHVFAAGAFTYLMLRRMGTSRAGALCGGVVFELGGFFASQTQHIGAIEGAAWIPLMWTAAWGFRNVFAGWWFFILAVASGMTILAGFPAMAATALISTILYTGLLLLFGHIRLRQAGSVIASIALGIGSSAIMLIPAAQLTLLSVGKYRTDWFDGWGFPLKDFATLLMPPSHKTICNLIYSGIGGLTLAVIGASSIRSKPRRKAVLPVLIITAFSAIWMLGNVTIFGRAVWAITPNLLKGSLYPHYSMAVFCLGIAVLAGIGLDQIRWCSARYKYLIAAAVAADLIFVNSGRPMSASDLREEPGITREQINGSAVTLSSLRHLADAGSLVRFDTHETSPAWTMTAPLTQLQTANGYDPLVLERIIQVRLSFAKGYRWGAWYEVENLASPMINALNVRYILSYRRLAATASGTPDLFLRAELPGLFVYENPSALTRFFLVHQIRLVHQPEEAFTEIHRADFKPSSVAVVEETSSPEWNVRAHMLQGDGKLVEQGGADGIGVRRYDAQDVTLAIRAKTPSFLVTSEVQYPGWHAWIDGSEVPIFMTNGAFRGLVIPVGDHLVRFRFMPQILNFGVGISALSICAALFISRMKSICPSKSRTAAVVLG